VKPYSGHLVYEKMMTIVKKFYYWTNLRRYIANFMSRCLDCQQVKVECRHPLNCDNQSEF